MIKWTQSNIFTLSGILIISTNEIGIHGAGLAREAKERGLIKQGTGTYQVWMKQEELFNVVKIWPIAITFPVKHNWWEKADLELIKNSFKELAKTCEQYEHDTFNLPLVGCGLGEADIDVIVPMIREFAENHLNITVVLPISRPKFAGKSRNDSTFERLDEIKKLLGIV